MKSKKVLWIFITVYIDFNIVEYTFKIVLYLSNYPPKRGRSREI